MDMSSESHSSDRLIHPELPQLEKYLTLDEIDRMRQILSDVTNHRISETQRAHYNPSDPEGFRALVNQKRWALQKGSLDPAEEQSWRERVGTSEEDIRELMAIGKKFTDVYNREHFTALSTREGRSLMLKMAMVHQIEGRSEEEGERRRGERIRSQVMEYLRRNTSVRSEATFTDRLPKYQEHTWRELSPLSGYASSGDENELILDYKTAEGDYGHAVFRPEVEPLVIDGRIIEDRDQVHEFLERYGGMHIRVKRWYFNGVVQDSCHDLISLFQEVSSIK